MEGQAAPPGPPAPKPNPTPPEPKPNGSPPGTETPPPPPVPDVEKRMALLMETEKRLAADRMKTAAERKAGLEAVAKEKAELESWRKEKAEYEQLRADRRRNPAKYAQADYGDDWYNILSKVQLDGSPPGDLIASELQETSKTLEGKIKEVDSKWEKKWAEREQQIKDEQKRSYLTQAKAFVDGNKDKYPLVHAYKLQSQIAAFIDNHERETAQTDDEGNALSGEVLTFEEAAKRMEEHLRATHEEAHKLIEPKSTPTDTKPVVANGRQTESPRKTLTQQLTGSSGNGQPQKLTESERRRRAIAAGEAVAAKIRAERG